ncbi:MAG: MFS transporter [Nitriliruptoraceae bacterium]
MTAPLPARASLPGRSPLRVLLQRPFGVFFIGSALSSIGTWFQNIAAGLLVYSLTGSTLLVGVVSFSQFVGSLVLAPWAGGAADRYDRRRLLLVSQSGAATIALLLAAVTLAGWVTAPIVVVAALLLGFTLAFMVPALQSLVPLLVDDEDLDVAISLNSMSFNLARAVGPVLGAVVVESAGHGVVFGLNAGSFLAFVVVLLVIRPRPQRRQTGPRPKLREAYRLVRDHQVWWGLMLATAAVSWTTEPINTLSPELAIDVFGGRELDAGLLVGAFGAGATLTALTISGWLRRQRHALVVAMLVQGGGMVMVGLAPTLTIGLIGMAISGVGFLGAITRSTARLQGEVPDTHRGRVMALWSVAFIGTRPLASLVGGSVAEVAGAPLATIVLALPVLLLVPWLHRRLARARQWEPSDGVPPRGDTPASGSAR